jgi:hypothetical protein
VVLINGFKQNLIEEIGIKKNLKNINPFEDVDDDGWLDTDWKEWVSFTGLNDNECYLKYKPRNSAKWYWW